MMNHKAKKQMKPGAIKKNSYSEHTLTKEALINQDGPILVEFGENRCSICQQSQPLIQGAIDEFREGAKERAREESSDIQRMMILDGKGKRLGRQFKVKLWPTLFLINNGEVKGTLVRPDSQKQIKDWLISLSE